MAKCRNTKIASFHSNAVGLLLHYCIARLQPVASLIYSVLLLATHADAAAWLPKFRSQLNSALGCYGAIDQKKGSWEFCTAPVGLCWTQDVGPTGKSLAERQNCYQLRVIRRTFVETVRYFSNKPNVHWLSLHAWWRTTPIFETATDTVPDWVNIKRDGNILQDGMRRS